VRKLKKIPKVDNEASTQEFWANADAVEYLDWSKAKLSFFPQLKPSSRTISIRLPEALLESIKVLANRRDVPYQSMLKILLADKVRESFNAKKGKGKAA
jgi:predicted DNA binding CopG/RHH family protein